MHSKKKCQKNNSESHFKPKKRKTISPIQIRDNSSLTTLKSGQLTGQPEQWNSIKSHEQWNIGVSPDQSQSQNKRFHQSSPGFYNFEPYFVTNLDALTNMSMSFSQMPFGQQMMQSPPFSSQFNPQFSAMGTSSNSSPPQWATQIIEDIKSIKLSVSKIESIEKTVKKNQFKG